MLCLLSSRLRRLRALLARRSSRVAPLAAPGESAASRPAAPRRWWVLCGRTNRVGPAPSLPLVGGCSRPEPAEPPVEDAGAPTPSSIIKARLRLVDKARPESEEEGKDRRHRVSFLKTLIEACRNSLQRGERRLPFSKGLAAQAVLEEMEYTWEDPLPPYLFSLCAEALTLLSRMKPCFCQSREHKIISGCLFWMSVMPEQGPQQDQEDLFLPPEEALQGLLRALLSQRPSLEHLIHITEAINSEVETKDEQEEAVAERAGCLLLDLATGPPFYFEAEKIKPLLPFAVLQVWRMAAQAKDQDSTSSSEEDLLQDVEFWDD
ncbi:uncharacterized protein LOC128336804 isoform X1 [Hemicordylus capensis]|uniref:uncharacterized protein LOC128336804 isoform X1 n=1 Tax=Hemicordylus capensis TaxID=884348 RepID=UPI0023021B74|nr:uncharacterized protein LOC128336804 isoform X1 [Hemicordylus capensis]XP_053132965.1 uncharacterized protein LOC128336804 isoform X1 [Hemicordylus capensis]XP_053132966.1 uncharacterized protein LOC128336804 isoform X1 [Hemicordylus capensis]